MYYMILVITKLYVLRDLRCCAWMTGNSIDWVRGESVFTRYSCWWQCQAHCRLACKSLALTSTWQMYIYTHERVYSRILNQPRADRLTEVINELSLMIIKYKIKKIFSLHYTQYFIVSLNYLFKRQNIYYLHYIKTFNIIYYMPRDQAITLLCGFAV